MALELNLILGICRTGATLVGVSQIESRGAGGRRKIMLISIAGAALFMTLLSVSIFLPKSVLAVGECAKYIVCGKYRFTFSTV